MLSLYSHKRFRGISPNASYTADSFAKGKETFDGLSMLKTHIFVGGTPR